MTNENLEFNPVTNVPNSFVEVKLTDDESFLKVRETLTRMGVASKSGTKKLFQSAHILHKRDINGNPRFYIVHFKEMFLLDGKDSTLSAKDIERRNTIVFLLEEWGLLTVVNPESAEPVGPSRNVKIIPYSEKNNWTLETKYAIGNTRSKNRLKTELETV